MDPWQNLNISLFLIGCEASPFPCPFITRVGAMKQTCEFLYGAMDITVMSDKVNTYLVDSQGGYEVAPNL
jgi:hypothetical protein